MRWKRTIRISAVLLLSLMVYGHVADGQCPGCCRIDNVPRIKQNHNYCGPATLASVLRSYGESITQEVIGKAVYDPIGGSTNGADMLFFARSKGYAAYSWNSSIADAKKKLAAGVPIICLQQNSLEDTSGHYRILTGYDDAAGKFYVVDPYYDDITELTYAKCDKLWRPMGFWGLAVIPAAKDRFQTELGAKNPVVHMDMSYAMYTRGDFAGALNEAKTALALEPGNGYSMSLMNKINRAMGAGKKRG